MKDFKPSSAMGLGVQVSPACFVCEKQIVDGQWFCRLPQKADGVAVSRAMKILLCSPACALRYFGGSRPGGNSEPNYDGDGHSLPIP